MTGIIFLTLALAVLALAGMATGLFAAWQTRAVAAVIQGKLEVSHAEFESRAEALEERLQAIAAQVQDLERQPSVTLAAGLPKPGMNVVKRSQALRLHRRGEQPEKIAASLDLPRQEVDLLLKVHSIVIGSA
jgi:hypothetical protein